MTTEQTDSAPAMETPEPIASPVSMPVTPEPVDTPGPEPVYRVSEEDVSDFIENKKMLYPPERIEMLYDNRVAIVIYSKHDVYEIYEITRASNEEVVITKKKCSNYTYPLYRMIFRGNANGMNLPYFVMKIYDRNIYENAARTVIHGFDGTIEFDNDGRQLMVCADENLEAINRAVHYDSEGNELSEYYFNRSVIEQPKVVPPQESIILDSGTKVLAWGGGTSSLRYDLDGDGNVDEIDFAFPGFGDNSHKIQYPDDIDKAIRELGSLHKDSVDLRINGAELSVRGIYFQGLIMVVDIDSSDDSYELLIAEEGPSCDYFSTFVGFNGSEPYVMGVVGGLPQYNTLVDGSGSITTHNRGRILHTWFYEARYVIEDGYLSEKIENGLINMNHRVTMKVDLPLQVSCDDDTPAAVLAAGTEALITWTDNESWCCIETSDGTRGWFEVENYQQIKSVDLWSGEVFDGLCMAD